MDARRISELLRDARFGVLYKGEEPSGFLVEPAALVERADSVLSLLPRGSLVDLLRSLLCPSPIMAAAAYGRYAEGDFDFLQAQDCVLLRGAHLLRDASAFGVKPFLWLEVGFRDVALGDIDFRRFVLERHVDILETSGFRCAPWTDRSLLYLHNGFHATEATDLAWEASSVLADFGALSRVSLESSERARPRL